VCHIFLKNMAFLSCVCVCVCVCARARAGTCARSCVHVRVSYFLGVAVAAV
jgi:hypothetical protein